MIVFATLYLLIAVFIVYLVSNLELFTVPIFIKHSDAEFRGINLLGLNANDGHFAAADEALCQTVCARNAACKGYSYYQPGQRCYLFSTGDFVPERPGFFSGKKI